MSSILKWTSFIGFLLFLAPTVTAPSDDCVISIPEGWVVRGTDAYSASPGSNAVVAYQIENNYVKRSMVIQASLSGIQHETEFEGLVWLVKYAPDGTSLLVHERGHTGNRKESTKYLLDRNGQILWAKTDDRHFDFSSTGEVVWAWQVLSMEPGPGGNKIEIFDLSGTILNVLELDPAPWGVEVIGNGGQVLVANRATLLSLDTSATPPATVWAFVAPQGYGDLTSMELLDDQYVNWRTSHFVSAIIDIDDGSLAYTYDPVGLGESDTGADKYQYARYQLKPGPSPGTIRLFDGTSGVQTLTIANGGLVASSIDVEPPGKGFEIGPWILEERLFFFSESEVRVRPIQ